MCVCVCVHTPDSWGVIALLCPLVFSGDWRLPLPPPAAVRLTSDSPSGLLSLLSLLCGVQYITSRQEASAAYNYVVPATSKLCSTTATIFIVLRVNNPSWQWYKPGYVLFRLHSNYLIFIWLLVHFKLESPKAFKKFWIRDKNYASKWEENTELRSVKVI